MTDRAQPGAFGSNPWSWEIADIMGQFSDGWVVPGETPTRSARESDVIDESVLDGFDASWSANSLTVTIQPGEAFLDGWLARDEPTDVELDASVSGQTIYIGWDEQAVYDDQQHSSRDDADRVIIGLESDFSNSNSKAAVWEFDTDSDGVVSDSDLRRVSPSIDAVNRTYDTDGTGIIDRTRVGGLPEFRESVSQSFNDIYRQISKHDFELSLSQLEYRRGDYEIYADSSRVNEYVRTQRLGRGDESRLELIEELAYNTTVFDNLGDMTGGVDHVEFSPDGEYLACGSWDENVYIYSTEDFSLLETLTDGQGRIMEVAWSSDMEYLASCDESGENVHLYSVSDWSHLQTLNEGSDRIETVRFSPDGEYLAYGRSDSDTYVHNVGSWSLETQITEGFGTVFTLDFSPDSNYLSTGDGQTRVRIYDVSDWSLVDEIAYSNSSVVNGTIRSIRFSPSGTLIAYGGDADNVYVHETNNWTLVETLSNAQDDVWGVSFDPSTGYLAYGSFDETVYLHNTWDWSLEQTFTESVDRVLGVAISPDAEYLAYGSRNDETAYLHNLDTRTLTSDGSATNRSKELSFTPESIVLSQTVDLPPNTDITYLVSDDDDNERTIGQAEIDTELDLDFTSSEVQVRVDLETTGSDSPELYDWAVYFDGS